MVPPYKKNYVVGAILFIALLIRIGQAFFGPAMQDMIWSDMRGYVQIAEMIEAGVWNANHFFQSIGFPVLIVFLKSNTPSWTFNLTLINCLLSFMTVVLVWRTAEDVIGPKIGLISLLVATVHFPWILLISYAMPETIFTFLLAVCAFMSVKILKGPKPTLAAFIWGISFICAFWLKGTHALWGPIFLAGLLFNKKKQATGLVIALCVPVAFGLILHGALTYSKIGKVQLSASTSGLNFIEGKCPHKKNRDNAGYTWQSPLFYQLDLHTEKIWDRPFTDSSYYWQQGIECIKQDPSTLIQSFEAIPYLFFGNTTWPLNQLSVAGKLRLYELIFAVFLIVGLIIYSIKMKRDFRAEEFLIFVTPVLAIFLCSYIFKSEMRYRLPFDLWFIPMAISGWVTLLKRPRLLASQE